MEDFILHMAQHPMLYIGYLFAFSGGAGVLLFFAGIFGGISHLFTYNHSAPHMEHARTRSLWGLYLCMVTLGFWELLRVITGEAPGHSLILILILIAPLWIPALRKAITGGGGGH